MKNALSPISHSAIKTFFQKLKEHESLIAELDKGKADRVFKGEFVMRGGEVYVKVQAFTIDSYETGVPDLLSTLKCVNASTDWFHKDTLWFRRENKAYVAFIEYIEAYRDRFCVEGLTPVLEFIVKM